QTREALQLLPELAAPWERRVGVGTIEQKVTKNPNCPEYLQQRFPEMLKEAGVQHVFQAEYLLAAGKLQYCVATIVNLGSTEEAFGVWSAMRPKKEEAISLGCDAWHESLP